MEKITFKDSNGKDWQGVVMKDTEWVIREITTVYPFMIILNGHWTFTADTEDEVTSKAKQFIEDNYCK